MYFLRGLQHEILEIEVYVHGFVSSFEVPAGSVVGQGFKADALHDTGLTDVGTHDWCLPVEHYFT